MTSTSCQLMQASCPSQPHSTCLQRGSAESCFQPLFTKMLLFGKSLSYGCLKASSHSYLNYHLLHEACPRPAPELQSLTESYFASVTPSEQSLSLCPKLETEALCAQPCTPLPSIELHTIGLCHLLHWTEPGCLRQ